MSSFSKDVFLSQGLKLKFKQSLDCDSHCFSFFSFCLCFISSLLSLFPSLILPFSKPKLLCLIVCVLSFFLSSLRHKHTLTHPLTCRLFCVCVWRWMWGVEKQLSERFPPCKTFMDSFMTIKVRRWREGIGEKVPSRRREDSFSWHRCQDGGEGNVSYCPEFTLNEKCAGDAGRENLGRYVEIFLIFSRPCFYEAGWMLFIMLGSLVKQKSFNLTFP